MAIWGREWGWNGGHILPVLSPSPPVSPGRGMGSRLVIFEVTSLRCVVLKVLRHEEFEEGCKATCNG